MSRFVFFFATVALLFAGAFATTAFGQAVSSSPSVRFQVDSLPRAADSGCNWELSIQVDHRSNAIDNAFAATMLIGGALSPEAIAAARDEMRSRGTLGLRGNIRFETSDLAARRGWRIESGIVSDVRWTPELFDLVFAGNAPHLGRFDVLNGTRGRAWQLNTIMRTGFWKNAHNALHWGLGLAHRSVGAQGDISTGYFWVSSNVDTLYTSLYGRSTVLEAQGLGLAGQIRYRRTDPASQVALTLEATHLGALFVAPGDVRVEVDTVLGTTGLPLAGDGWSIESLQGEGFAESLIVRDTLAGHFEALPTALSGGLTGAIIPGLAWEVRATVGGWRPTPEAMAGLQFKVGRRSIAGIRAVYGGWGKLRPAIWAALPVGQHHTLTLYAEDPVAAFQGTGLGRGFGLQLAKSLPTGADNRR